jgi:hypothetical protein
MSKIKEDVAKQIAEFLTEIEAPTIADYVKENIAKYLPDIDTIEKEMISSNRILAKIKIEDFRNYKSVAEALWEMILREKDSERRELLKRLWNTAEKKATKFVAEATLAKARAETLEQFGLMEHENKLLPILYATIPLILLLVLPKQ